MTWLEAGRGDARPAGRGWPNPIYEGEDSVIAWLHPALSGRMRIRASHKLFVIPALRRDPWFGRRRPRENLACSGVARASDLIASRGMDPGARPG